ncbi:MAG TPA: hypothetical protein VIL52_07135 [Bacteroidota bacterium]
MNNRFNTVVLVFCLTAFSACGIFEPRDPDPPAQSGSNYIPPTEPSLVFTNMVNAFRDMNAVNYVRSFADIATAGRNYIFEPTSEARQRYGTIFVEWTRQSEQQFFENMKSRVQSGTAPSLEFLTQVAQSIQSDSAQYEVTYRLNVPHGQTNIPTQAQGRAVFYMIADNSRNWVIWRWVDIAQAQDDFTWSDFKGQFGQ